MKNIIATIAGFVLLLLLQNSLHAQELPKRPSPPRLVNDFTGTLTAAQIQALESKLVTIDDSTSSQIAVVIIKSLNGYDVSEYAVKLGRAWGIGGKEHNNGVLLLIAKEDRKINIATGFGLEGALPDITCKQIIDNEIVPNFKSDDYYRGIDQGSDAIIKAVKGEYQVAKKRGKKIPGPGAAVAIIALILFIIFSSGGRGGGGYYSGRGYRSHGGPVFWGGGLGGGGGSRGGGGFGGFGGGSFGGGGASGSW
jgi:uncharacterized protein